MNAVWHIPISLELLTKSVQLDKDKDTVWSLMAHKLTCCITENSSPSTDAIMGLQKGNNCMKCAVTIQNP